ncbi:nuclear pore complex protein nup93 [Anaeramoeba flamelloides]|uniref:Nuclear pore protein n=1 Tax=Anaeramoeba flamelloides TaxID=1746091 RepID=A0AAV7Y4G8_9EUKA|nr:nuclear pore complex protein nup93 [Anaeramoeba flamelloides]
MDELLLKAQRLNDKVQEDPSISFIRRDLQQISQQSQNLVSKSNQAIDTSEVINKGKSLLARTGFNSEQLARRLHNLKKITTIRYDEVETLDISLQLSLNYQSLVLSSISKIKDQTTNEFTEFTKNCLLSGWEQTKQLMLEAKMDFTHLDEFSQKYTSKMQQPFVDRTSTDFDHDIGQPQKNQFFRATPPNLGTRKGFVSEKMLLYSKVIKMIMLKNKKETSSDLISMLRYVAKHMLNVVNENSYLTDKIQFIDLWTLIRYFSKECSFSNNHQMYINAVPSFSNLLISASKSFLELQFKEYIKNKVRQNPRKAKIGGVPGTLSLVSGYINLIYQSSRNDWPEEFEDMISGFPIWPLVYFSIRCGDPDSALELLTSKSASQCKDAANCAFYLKLRLEDGGSKFTKKARSKALNDYRRIDRESNDPYKQMLFNIIGKFEITPNNSILQSIEDYMWFHLVMLHDNYQKESINYSGDNFNLKKFQQIILEHGSKHFSKRNNEIQYFRILLLSQQYELAISYLAGCENYLVEAVHFAIGLNNLGLLRLPDDSNNKKISTKYSSTASSSSYKISTSKNSKLLSQVDFDPIFLLTDKKNDNPILNFDHLIKHYISSFYQEYIDEALCYLNLINNRQNFYHYVKEIALNTKQFSLLFGSQSIEGDRKPGKLDDIISSEEIYKIIKLTSQDCLQLGFIVVSIKLYDLTAEHDLVIKLLNKELGNAITRPKQEKAEIIELAQNIYHKYEMGIFNTIEDSKQVNNFKICLGLNEFFDDFNDKNYGRALSKIENLNLIPFVPSTVHSYVEHFKEMGKAISKNMGNILIASMSTLYHIYRYIKKNNPQIILDRGQENYLKVLKERSRCLIRFAGMIGEGITSQVNKKLLKIHVLMK